jgi:subtilisin family serine protease
VLFDRIAKDKNGELIGYDFVSNDSRPFDDAYHGTAVASLVLAVNPRARIIPIKAFSPWGITSTQALVNSVQYAIDHGAQIIVCAWATPAHSAALEAALIRARDRKIKIVVSTGDSGFHLDRFQRFPVGWTTTNDHLLAVTVVGNDDRTWVTFKKATTFSDRLVSFGVPGVKVPVALPRAHWGYFSGSAASTAIAAGVYSLDPKISVLDFINRNTIEIKELKPWIKEGRRMRLSVEASVN